MKKENVEWILQSKEGSVTISVAVSAQANINFDVFSRR